MHPRFKLIALIMALAFIAFVCAIEYADRHPITDAEIAASKAR